MAQGRGGGWGDGVGLSLDLARESRRRILLLEVLEVDLKHHARVRVVRLLLVARRADATVEVDLDDGGATQLVGVPLLVELRAHLAGIRYKLALDVRLVVRAEVARVLLPEPARALHRLRRGVPRHRLWCVRRRKSDQPASAVHR